MCFLALIVCANATFSALLGSLGGGDSGSGVGGGNQVSRKIVKIIHVNAGGGGGHGHGHGGGHGK